MSKRGNCKRFASETLAENVARALWEHLRNELDENGDTPYGRAWLEIEVDWEKFSSCLGQVKHYFFNITHEPILFNGQTLAEQMLITVELRKQSEASSWVAAVASANSVHYYCIPQPHGHYSFKLCPHQ